MGLIFCFTSAGTQRVCGVCVGLNSAEVYDPRVNEWRYVACMSTRRSSVGVGVVSGMSSLSLPLVIPAPNIARLSHRLMPETIVFVTPCHGKIPLTPISRYIKTYISKIAFLSVNTLLHVGYGCSIGYGISICVPSLSTCNSLPSSIQVLSFACYLRQEMMIFWQRSSFVN